MVSSTATASPSGISSSATAAASARGRELGLGLDLRHLLLSAHALWSMNAAVQRAKELHPGLVESLACSAQASGSATPMDLRTMLALQGVAAKQSPQVGRGLHRGRQVGYAWERSGWGRGSAGTPRLVVLTQFPLPPLMPPTIMCKLTQSMPPSS